MGKFGYLSPAVSEISAWGKHHIAEKNKAKVLKKVM